MIIDIKWKQAYWKNKSVGSLHNYTMQNFYTEKCDTKRNTVFDGCIYEPSELLFGET